MLPRLILVAFLAGPAASLLCAADPEPALLERLEQLRRVARQTGNELWPGWDPTATPLAIYKGTEMGVLVGHPAPPANFRRFPTTIVSAPVFVADSTAGMVRANTAQVFAGTLTSFISYQDFMDKPAADALAMGIHELFHAHQNRIAPRKFGDILMVLWGNYPEFSVQNRALLVLEARMLHRAATAPDDQEARRSAGGFLGLRLDRRKDLTPEQARYESGEESSEGLARYVEFRLLRMLPAVNPAFKEAAGAAEKRTDALNNILGLERDRERFYALGMAQGLLLDRLRPDWKKEFESGPLLLDELLAQAAPPASAAETAALKAMLSFRTVVDEQQKQVAERREQGTRRLAELISAPGDRVVVEVAAAKNKLALRGINPNGALALSPDQIVQTFLLLDLGAEPDARMRMEFRGLPVVYDRPQDAFWFMLPAASVAKAVEAFAASPGAGRLLLQADGFSGEFTGIEVERRGRELHIRPATDLKRSPALKPPEFVRP